MYWPVGHEPMGAGPPAGESRPGHPFSLPLSSLVRAKCSYRYTSAQSLGPGVRRPGYRPKMGEATGQGDGVSPLGEATRPIARRRGPTPSAVARIRRAPGGN